MFILSIPFLFRAIYIVVRISVDMNSKISQSIKDDDWFAPIFSFVYIAIADLVPITAQLSSMLVVIDKESDSVYAETSESIIRETENYYYDSFTTKETKAKRALEGSADFTKPRNINGSEEFYMEKIKFNNEEN